MTARTLIVNHWQHYWTSSPSPKWICVGKLEETVINQPITHKRVCTEIFPQCTEAKALYFTLHMHTHIRIYNKCADKLGRDRSFSYVSHCVSSVFCLLQSSAFILQTDRWDMKRWMKLP